MNYIIKLFNSDLIEITEQEFANLKGKEGLVFVPSLNEAVNTKTIYRILPKDKWENEQREKNIVLKEGRLHDGTRVIKKFGKWVLANNEEVAIDEDHYPEIKRGQVLSESDWNAVESGKLKLTTPKREIYESKVLKMME